MPQACDTAAALTSPSANSLVIPTVRLLCNPLHRANTPRVGIVQHVGSPIAAVPVTCAAGSAALAALAWFGIRINALYGGPLGRASIPHKGSGQSAAGVFSSSPRNGKDSVPHHCLPTAGCGARRRGYVSPSRRARLLGPRCAAEKSQGDPFGPSIRQMRATRRSHKAHREDRRAARRSRSHGSKRRRQRAENRGSG